MSEQQITVFTDGASKGNPGPGGWGVIIVTPDGHVTELGGGAPLTTNNKMELTGAIEALSRLQGTRGPVSIYTDSTYVIQGIAQWVHGWKRRGWKTAAGTRRAEPGACGSSWRPSRRRAARARIAWHYVRGHVGIPGNERVDEIADSFAVQQPVALYDGPLLRLSACRSSISPTTPTVPARSKPSSGASRSRRRCLLVPQRRRRQADAPRDLGECEQRVKGRSGARFKKATSAADEEAILRSWGLEPDDV